MSDPIVFEYFPHIIYGPDESIIIRFATSENRFYVDKNSSSKQGSDYFRIATNMVQRANNYLKEDDADWNKIIFFTKSDKDGTTFYHVVNRTPPKESKMQNVKFIIMNTGEIFHFNENKFTVTMDQSVVIDELNKKVE